MLTRLSSTRWNSAVRMAWAGKEAPSSSPTLNSDGWVEGPRTNNNVEGWHSKVNQKNSLRS